MGRLTLRVPRWLTGRGGPWEGGKTVLKLGRWWKHRKAEAPRGSAPAPGMIPPRPPPDVCPPGFTAA